MTDPQSLNNNQLQFFITSDVALILSLPYRSILFPDPSRLAEEQNWLQFKPAKLHRVLVIFLMNNQMPVGCIGGFYDQPERFTIATWAVQRNLLNNKLGQHLLLVLEKQLRRLGFSELEINYRDDLRSKSVIEHVLSKNDWLLPQLRIVHFKMKVIEDKLPPWFDRFDRLINAELFLWTQINREETANLQEAIENGKIPRELSPFQQPSKLANELSLGIRRNRRVVGWLVVHRIREDLMNYTCLWTEPECRRLGYGLYLIKTALSRQARFGPENLIFQVDPANQTMLDCLSNRLSELVTSNVPLWTSAKRLR